MKLLAEIKDDKMVSPTRITVSPNTDFIVTDPLQHLVHVFAASGKKLYDFPISQPLGCAVDAGEKIYIGDQTTGSVSIHDRWGKQIGQLGQGAGEFVMPNEVEIDPSGKVVFVADSKANKVKAYNVATGSGLFSFGSQGTTAGKFDFPMGVLFDETASKLYIGDHNNHRVQVFNLKGTWQATIGSFGSGKGQFIRPEGLAMDKQGRLYVVAGYAGHVQVLTQQGQHLAYIGSFGAGQGKMSLPSDAVVDSHNRLYVTSYMNRKVMIYGIDNHTAPPKLQPATLRVYPGTLHAASRAELVKVHVELPKSASTEILLGSVRLNKDLAPEPGRPVVGDADGDAIADVLLLFSKAKLLKLLAKGKQQITVHGKLSTNEMFEGQQTVVVK